MGVRIEKAESTVKAILWGEIDHHCAPDIRNQIDLAVDENRSGIGLVMGRYQTMKGIGGKVTLENTPAHIKKVMRLAGLDRFANIM